MKLKEVMIHFILVFSLLIVIMIFLILCTVYDKISIQRDIDLMKQK